MKSPPAPEIRFLLGLCLFLSPAVPGDAVGQEIHPGAKHVYFRALADHFEVPVDEVFIVGEWDLAADEVPVVLFIASKAGVSPDALIGLRRQGRSWKQIALRLGMGLRSFYIALPEQASMGFLGRAQEEFRRRPPTEWDGIELSDPEIIGLVNLRVLSQAVGVSPLRVLQSHAEAGNFVAAYARLLGRPVHQP